MDAAAWGALIVGMVAALAMYMVVRRSAPPRRVYTAAPEPETARYAPPAPAPAVPESWKKARLFQTRVAGISRRQDVARTCRPGDALSLVREPGNRADRNAIAVYAASGGQLGYIRSEVAGSLAHDMDNGRGVVANIREIMGGTADKPSIGVVINVQVERLR